jgi:subtilisin family serine protease
MPPSTHTCREAYAQGDTIWVAAAGNNGTDGPEALDAKGNNWCSYPACYPEVISVGAVNCTLGKSQFSQKNGMIQVVGPGEDMVSTRPLKYMEGGTRGFLQMKDAPGLSMRLIGGAVNGGVGNATGPLVWCGLGNTPCDVPPGGICMYTAAGRGMPNPARGLNFCDRVLNCTKAGGAGVVLTPPANWNLTGKVEDYPLDRVPVIGLNCTALNCSCWAQYSATPVDKRAPAVVVSRRQANQLRAALNVASAAGKQLSVEIQTQRNYWDTSAGTSMATPYVTGVIARVWGLFPECNNTEITNAVYASAKDLGPRGKDVQYGWGLVQMEAAYKYLLTQPCGKQSLQSRKQTRSPAVPTAKPRSPAPARSKPGVAPPLVLKPPAAKVAPVVARRTGAAAASN